MDGWMNYCLALASGVGHVLRPTAERHRSRADDAAATMMTSEKHAKFMKTGSGFTSCDETRATSGLFACPLMAPALCVGALSVTVAALRTFLWVGGKSKRKRGRTHARNLNNTIQQQRKHRHGLSC